MAVEGKTALHLAQQSAQRECVLVIEEHVAAAEAAGAGKKRKGKGKK